MPLAYCSSWLRRRFQALRCARGRQVENSAMETLMRLSRPLLAGPLLSVAAVLGLALALAVAAFPAIAADASGATTGPMIPILNPDGAAKHGVRGQTFSSNWSGYAVLRAQTGQSYTAASGAWVMPSVTSPVNGQTAYSSTWVGIGGSCSNSRCTKRDHTLIQLGTEQDSTGYFAWYEVLPRFSVLLSTSTYPVAPGDTITASLRMTGTTRKGQTWHLSMSDQSSSHSNWAFTTTLDYNSSLASAEWIVEDPSVIGPGGALAPLANFGTITIDNGTITTSGSTSSVSPNLTASEAVWMQTPTGYTASTSDPDAEKDGFSDCWGSGGAFTSCPVP